MKLFKDFAIELEIASEFLHNYEALESLPYKHETNKICEFKDFHLNTPEQIEEAMRLVTDEYRLRFPIGSDNLTSGGVHAHLIGKDGDTVINPDVYAFFQNYGDYSNLANRMYYMHMNTLLFAKPYATQHGLHFVSRRFSSLQQRGIDCNSKHAQVVLKRPGSHWGTNDSTISSVEFRWNNVIDERIGAYYLAILLMLKNNKRLLPLREYRDQTCISEEYYSGDLTYIDIQDVIAHRSTSPMRWGSESMKRWFRNMNRLIRILVKSMYIEEANQLISYVNELTRSAPVDMQIKPILVF